MNLKRVTMRKFMSHADTTVLFPERGLVAVQGANRAGKSSIVEAVSYCGWGETLRGTPPWSGDDGMVEVETTDDLVVTRTRKRGKVMLKWSYQGKSDKWETPTKAEEALVRLLGPWDVWRRSAVFSSADAAHFTLAPDSERKRLLEAVLGLDRFDVALETCRRDLKVATKSSAELSRQLDVLRARHESELRRVDDARMSLARAEADATPQPGEPPVPPADVQQRRNQLHKLATKADAELSSVRQRLRVAATRMGHDDATLHVVEKQLAQLRAELCPTCGQEINKAQRDKLHATCEQERTKLGAAKVATAAEIETLNAQVEELEEEARTLRQRVNDLDSQLGSHLVAVDTHRRAVQAYEAAQRWRESTAKVLAEAVAAAGELELAVLDADEQYKAAASEVAVLDFCEPALGTRGFRASVLAHSLSGLEVSANAWLSRISGGTMSLTLSPYTEQKTAGVADKIDIKLTGAGAGYGYKASSGGERRRVDIALVVGLGEVAAGAYGRTAGTLFNDEIFDALDVDGIERVAEALRETAQDRCVVVVSHSDAMVTALRAPIRWVVSAGHVTVE